MEVYVTYKKRWDQGVDKVFSDEDAAIRYKMDQLEYMRKPPYNYDEKALRIEAQSHVEEIVVSEEY